MNILVLDVAADSGGALTILNHYYDKFLNDKKNKYFFCTSVTHLKSDSNITILNFPWVKKSWIHRIWFDNIYGKHLIKDNNIDYIFSLQNTCILGTKIPQTIYLHQPLPYINHKIKFSENKKLWVYQNLISKIISKSVKKADKVIVQTHWMKDAVIFKEKINPSKIEIIPPTYDVDVKNKFLISKFENTFFYPASNYIYKNHKIILQAVDYLLKNGIKNFRVLFTLEECTLPKGCLKLYKKCKENVVLLGNISHKEVINLYSKSVLIFPSYIETFGLPLLEARCSNTPIIASDMSFSREILEKYENVNYFKYDDYENLSQILISFLNNNCLEV